MKRLTHLVAAVAIGALSLTAGCGTPNARAPLAKPVATPPPATVSQSPAPAKPAPAKPNPALAGEHLAGFFTQSQQMDVKLRHAAALINAGFVGHTVQVDRATIDAIREIQPWTLARTIPGGLDRDLQRSVLLVYSDLAARRAAMNGVIEYASGEPLPRDSVEGRHLLACLANGSRAAATFKEHLTAARTAASVATLTLAAPTSRQAAEAAIQARYIEKHNNGCDACGGYILRDLPPLTWKSTVEHGDRFDGTVGGVLFQARYQAAQGWTVSLNAC